MITAVNWLAVLVASVINMALGMLWYGPLFGKQWIAMMGFTKQKMDAAKKKGMAEQMVFAFISALVMNYVLAIFVGAVQATTAWSGALLGFWVWLGFVATVMLGSVLWEGRHMKLYAINVLHYLVLFMINGALLAVWM